MHEAVLEDIFSNDRSSFRLRGQRHVLRLHIGWKSGIFFGHDIGGAERVVAHHAHGFCRVRSLHAHFIEFLQQGA